MYLPLQHHTEQFHCPENPLCSAYPSLLPLIPWQPLVYSLSPYLCLFQNIMCLESYSMWPPPRIFTANYLKSSDWPSTLLFPPNIAYFSAINYFFPPFPYKPLYLSAQLKYHFLRGALQNCPRLCYISYTSSMANCISVFLEFNFRNR